MAKVTSKYQVTVPRKIAEEYHIRPGDDIDWVPAGDAIRVIPTRKQAAPPTPEARLRCFDQATGRQKSRQRARSGGQPPERGWRREDLYGRGRAR